MGHWNFTSYNGTSVTDASGHSHGGTLYNGAAISAQGGGSGNFARMDGVNDYMTVNDHADLEPGGGFTISVWMNPQEVLDTGTVSVINQWDDYYINIVDREVQFHVGGTSSPTVTGPYMSINQWVMVTGVFDPTADQIRLYVNGELIAVNSGVTGAPPTNTEKLFIGKDKGGREANVLLDEVRFYKRPLTDAEVSAIYDENPVSNWPTSTPTPTATPTATQASGSTPTPTRTAMASPTASNPYGTGTDGSGTVALGTTVNLSTQSIVGRSCADAPAYSLQDLYGDTAILTETPAAGCLGPNDEILLINLRGSSTAFYNVGKYEFLRVKSVSGGTVRFFTAKSLFYGAGPFDDTDIGTGSDQQRVMLLRVPNYNNVTLNGSITANAFDGYRYGVIAFRVSGTLSGEGVVTASSLGYRGGGGAVSGSSIAPDGQPGESYAGYVTNQGGGEPGIYPGTSYLGNAGGGGGHATNGVDSTLAHDISQGGISYGGAELTRLYFGSGGGGGSEYGADRNDGGNGGKGGGIVFVAVNQLQYTTDTQVLTLRANGASGGTKSHTSDGGGGAGGSVRLEVNQANKASVLRASNGSGGDSNGGDGSVGRIAVYYYTLAAALDLGTGAYQLPLGATPTPTPTATPVTMVLSPYGDGTDGDLTIAAGETFNIHTDSNSSTFHCTDGGDAVSYSVTALTVTSATLSTAPSLGCLVPGDEIVLLNLEGTATDTTNVGRFEFLRVGAVSGSTLQFTQPKKGFYGDSASDDTNLGTGSSNQHVVVMRVPNYSDVTVDGTLTGSSYSGTRYGVILFRVKGTLSGSGTISVTGLGYRGGAGASISDGTASEDGESFGLSAGVSGAGGAGPTGDPVMWGGGAGYVTAGTTDANNGVNGQPYGNAEITRLWMGSGGGGGGKHLGGDGVWRGGSDGGDGGGVVYILANVIDLTGSITAKGQNGGSTSNGGPGGGGSGGSIRVESETISVGSTNVSGGQHQIGSHGGSFEPNASAGRVRIYSAQNPTATPTLTPTQTPIPAATYTFTSQPGGSGTDTSITSGSPDNSNGTDVLHIGRNSSASVGHGLLKFDLSSIPQSATISGATLSIWVEEDLASSSGTICAYRSRQNWTEAGATWNNYDGTNPWNTAGAYGSLDTEQANIGCANTTASQAVGSVITITLSPEQIQEMVSGVWVNRGIMLRMVVESAQNRYDFYSSDEATQTTKRPKLVVNYSVGLTATATPTTTPLPTNTPDWVNGAYTYDSARPHAVTTVTYTDTHGGSTANHYSYDANGNMTSRTVGGVTWTLTYDAENRLHTMANADVSTVATFIYDADGNKVAQINNGVATYYFMGGSYEVTGEAVRKYYALAGAMVAMRDADGLKYLLTDQLGSVVAVTDEDGDLSEQQRYLPFGGVRTDLAAPAYRLAATDHAYTGQQAIPSLGLMDYRARLFDPAIGRFTQPDSLVPGAANPQAWNRYSYVLNGPVNRNDPSGHYCLDAGEVRGRTVYNLCPSEDETPDDGDEGDGLDLGGDGDNGSNGGGGSGGSVRSGGNNGNTASAEVPAQDSDATYYSLSYTAGGFYWFGTWSLDIVITDDEIGVFQAYGTGPGYGGIDRSPFRWMRDMESTFVSPQVGVSFFGGNVYGKELRYDVRSYAGPAKVWGASAGSPVALTGESFSSADIESGGPNDNIRGEGIGLSLGPVPFEAHGMYVKAVYEPVFSEIANRLANMLGWP
jgi:RHS repeat-associated protein